MIIRGTILAKALAACLLTTSSTVVVVTAQAITSEPTTSPTSSPTSSPTEAPTSSPTQSPTILIGCPPQWTAGSSGDYAPGELVSHTPGSNEDPNLSNLPDIKIVYQCKEAPYNLYCPQSGFEPGSFYSPNAWIRLGKCNSALVAQLPTSAPTMLPTISDTPDPWEKVGCPEEYNPSSSTTYEEGSIVEFNNIVYECKPWPDAARCNQAGYEPFSANGNDAWNVLGSCSGSMAPTVTVTVDPWTKVGCPPDFTSGSTGESYVEGDIVSVNEIVYECKPWPEAARCSQAGYEPGTGSHFEEAWTTLGSCSGTIAPTPLDTADLWEKSGCPEAYTAGSPYMEGDVVSNDGHVYECTKWPYSQFCSQPGYEPGVSLHFANAWNTLGSCLGTMVPTPTVTIDPWEKVGCPPEFDTTLQTRYEDGEVVSMDDVVYKCKPWPESARCNQAGYEPGVGAHFEEVWTILGSCSGTIAPTPFDTSDPWQDQNFGCPEPYSSAVKTYDDGSLVSESGVVYQCKPYPDAGFCLLHSPSSTYGYLGWTKLGSCVGTLVPTATVTFDPWEKLGCPQAFDESLETKYEGGEAVSRLNVVYECKSGWPQNARCNQAGWEPGSGQFWEEAWTMLGSCDGTIVPTQSPSREVLPLWEKAGCPPEYSTTTEYDGGDTVSAYGSRVFECKSWPNTGFCNMYSPEDAENGSLAWAVVGGCDGTIVPTATPTATPTRDFLSCAAPEWDPRNTFDAGDLVRTSDGLIYKCKEMPFTLWCNNPNYVPGTNMGGAAWVYVGPC